MRKDARQSVAGAGDLTTDLTRGVGVIAEIHDAEDRIYAEGVS